MSKSVRNRTDDSYVLQAIRLSALRYTDDPLTARVISLDPSVALNPYIAASGLADIDRWPEITRAIESPEPDVAYSSDEAQPRQRGLRYTQTIMGNKSGVAGMRVTGRRTVEGERTRRSRGVVSSRSPTNRLSATKLPEDGFFSRPRAGSAPQPILDPPSAIGSVIVSGKGMSGLDEPGALEHAASFTGSATDEEPVQVVPATANAGDDGVSAGVVGSGRPGASLGGYLLPQDDGSDFDEEEYEPAEESLEPPPDSKRSSHNLTPLRFDPVRFAATTSRPSTLTAALNKHIPHLVSTSSAHNAVDKMSNPFASLYASVAARPNVPFLALDLYFPHSREPKKALSVKVRKDSSVEEVTGYGLFKYWEEDRSPPLSDEQDEQKLTTISWGLRIVEDDGEVDEDFPRKSEVAIWLTVALDRDGQISRFSYGEFAIVEATEAQSA